jgi:type IV pilus assembly protein PilV
MCAVSYGVRGGACLRGRRSLAQVMQGVTLIECLIALVVLSIGMIGMARLMIEGLRAGHLALLRTQAVNLVSDMAERIRANPAGGAAYECASYVGGPSRRGCAPTDSTVGSNCMMADLAEDDLARWQGAARTLLPLTPSACAADVVYTAASTRDEPSRFQITVSWMERGEPLPGMYRSDLLLVPPP